jgi:omega-3 fatty acid desaturase (delta-15 desaturase)
MSAQWDLGAIKKSIPAHLYKSDMKMSFYYMARDYVFAISLIVGYSLALRYITYPALMLAVTIVYWFAQGTVFWAMFVTGHDCGHGSFSKNSAINDTVGTIVHGLILVPYYQWKMSHQHHHKNTGNIDVDEIFYPIRKSDQSSLTLNAKAVINNQFFFGFGWLMYLLAGYAGRNYEKNFVKEGETSIHNHFNPFDPMWSRRIYLSLTSVAFTLTVFLSLVYTCLFVEGGFIMVMQYYTVPWFVFASWLVMVTFLHHASEDTKWLAPSEWNYTRGQLENTTDRTYGTILDNITHNIGTHVVHHLFPIIPHYHLVEANKYLKEYTKVNNLPHNERIEYVSGLGEFLKNTERYRKNFIVSDDALYHCIAAPVEQK